MFLKFCGSDLEKYVSQINLSKRSTFQLTFARK